MKKLLLPFLMAGMTVPAACWAAPSDDSDVHNSQPQVSYSSVAVGTGTPGPAKVRALMPAMTRWFTSILNGDQAAAFSPDVKLKEGQLTGARQTVWQAWARANESFDEERLPELRPLSNEDSAQWHIPANLEPDAAMSFFYGTKGISSEPRPLYVYTHGSGPREREWATGFRICKEFADSPSVYFIPRIPREGEYYRWWQRGKQFAWERLLRQSLLNGAIDPERIYMFGISEGGYGSQRLASFYADYLAAAGPMAGGEPLVNAPAENCRNIAFSLRTGDRDFGFYRDRLTRTTAAAFDSLQRLSPDDYIHWIDIIPGRGHSIDYRPTTPWLSNFTRRSNPLAVTWENFEMDGIKRTGFYNLAVSEPDSLTCRTRYDMEITGNDIILTVNRVHYTTTETDPHWGIALKSARSYEPATSGTVTVYLGPQLVDLSKKVTLTVNGRKVYDARPALTLDNLMASCAEYFDPLRLYPAAITVDLATMQAK